VVGKVSSKYLSLSNYSKCPLSLLMPSVILPGRMRVPCAYIKLSITLVLLLMFFIPLHLYPIGQCSWLNSVKEGNKVLYIMALRKQ